MKRVPSQIDALLGARPLKNRYVPLVVPPLCLLIILVVDRRVQDITLTPLLSLATLAVLSLRLPPRAMAAWALVFAIAVFIALQRTYSASADPLHPVVTLFVRTATFIIGATICVTLSVTRTTLNQQFVHLKDLITKIPLPIIISDASGIIFYVNAPAGELLGQDSDALLGQTVFSLTGTYEKKGRAIQSYIELCDQPELGERESVIPLQTDAGVSIRYKQSGIRLFGNPAVMTVLMREEAGAEQRGIT